MAKELEASKGKNVLNDADERKKFKSSLAIVTSYFQQIDDLKEGASDTIASLSSEYGLDKKTIRKLAATMYKQNYGTLHEENRYFEILYETVIEGKLREGGNPLDVVAKQAQPDDDAE